MADSLSLPRRRPRETRARAVGYVLAGGLLVGYFVFRETLHDTSFASGYLLTGVVLFLTALHARKQIPSPPLGTAATWVRLHLVAGWLSVLLFAIHLRVRIPDGILEGVLALLFVFTAASGIVGHLLNRRFSRRLASLEIEVIYEDIPAQIVQLQERSDQIAVTWSERDEQQGLADFHQHRVAGFLRGSQRFLRHLLGDRGASLRLTQEMKSKSRYLDLDSQSVLEELIQIVRTKDDLDHHRALQGTLKYWLFLHIPATYAMWAVLVVHIVLAHLYHGGVR